ncbi:MAG: glycosyltransferase, partial [Patescibacteria group bacterium]
MIIGFDARLYGIHHRGIGRYCSSLLDQISQIDEINKYLLFANDDKIPHKFKSWQIVRAPYQAYSFSEQLNFYFTLRKYNHDLMHFPHWNIPVIYKQPYVVTIHDLILHYFSNERVTALPLWRYNLKINLYFKVIKRVIKKACKIIAVSESTAKDIVKFYPFAEKKISVIYEAPTIDGRHYNNQVSPRLIPREYLLNVGAAYPHKNLEQ